MNQDDRDHLKDFYMLQINKGVWALFNGAGAEITRFHMSLRAEANKAVDIARNLGDPDELHLCLSKYGII